jgi:MFS family permease
VHTTGELIAMRAVMGAGAAIITPLTMSVLPAMFPADADRRRAVAVTTICTMLGMPAGPLLAGWMLTHFAWGSVFLINGPLAALSLIGVAALVPESRDPAGPRLDWAGTLLSAAGLVIEKSAARLGVRLVICAGMLICCAGLALLLLAGVDSGYGAVALALAVFGIGLGLSLPLSADAVLATLPPSRTDAGSALNRALQRIAVSLAPAVLGSVLASAYRGSLGRAHDAAADRAYTHGMHLTALVSIAVLAVTVLLVAAFLPGSRTGERLPADGLEESTDPADSLL